MDCLYGKISQSAVTDEIISLHKSIHRLLYYKEEGYLYLDEYFSSLMCRLSGFLSLFSFKRGIELLSLLQSAKDEAKKENFNFKIYRKLILDSHTLLDEIVKDNGEVT